MVNNIGVRAAVPRAAGPLVGAYVVLAVATLPVLAVLTAVSPQRAGQEAWGHAVVVGVLAVVLPLRLRSAREGRPGARTAVVVIAGVLAAANLVEALLPGVFPGWMRVEMVGVAAVMVALLLTFAAAQGAAQGAAGGDRR